MTFASPILFILNVLTDTVQKHSSLGENPSIFKQLKYFLKNALNATLYWKLFVSDFFKERSCNLTLIASILSLS